MKIIRHNLMRWLTGAGLLIGLALLAGGLLAGPAHSAKSWTMQALSDGSFLIAAALTVLSAVLLGAIGQAMWRIAARRRPQNDSQGGTLMIEFALVLPIALMLVLILVQSSMLMAGNLCVHYSAFCAARAAATSVPLDYWPSEQPNVVDFNDVEGSAKLRRIKLAAVYAVMPVSCGDENLPDSGIALQDSLESYFGSIGQQTPHWVRAMIGRKWQYADEHTTIVLDPPADNQKFAPGEDVAVTVEHEFYLSIPYAGRLFSLGNDGVTFSLGASTGYATKIRATGRMTNEGVQDYIDVETFPNDGQPASIGQ